MRSFKQWILNEIGTSTACIAGFSRMTLPLVRRQWPTILGADEKDKKRKKPYKQPQVES